MTRAFKLSIVVLFLVSASMLIRGALLLRSEARAETATTGAELQNPVLEWATSLALFRQTDEETENVAVPSPYEGCET